MVLYKTGKIPAPNSVSISRTAITDNYLPNGSGGGIDAADIVSFIITDSTVSNNTHWKVQAAMAVG